ncbi:MAG: GIY-YIG nuclease family protein [Myxococcota bacterium]|nr:GIY-YIG nuclease family protein [Myxococcota bacterium]
MGVRRFDKKFGADLLRELPAEPAVYLFKDERGEVLYAGKAVDIRRRLRSYRSAGRRKAHRKMRRLVREASTLEVRIQASEREALLLENELIRTLRPRYNVDGAYSFLYPAIGVGDTGHQALLALTTRPEAWDPLALTWYGAFRSRARALAAFEALVGILTLLGHVEPRSRLPQVPRPRGSRLLGFRRLAPDLLATLRRFLAGEARDALGLLAQRLLEKPHARREAGTVEEHLRELEAFHESDLAPLRAALREGGLAGSYVPRDERDALFIRARTSRPA